MAKRIDTLRSLARRAGPVTVAAALILTALILIGLIEPFLPSASFKEVASGPRRGAPSAEFWLGTDNLGRSVLARILEGIRLTFLLSAAAVFLAGVVGAAIGMAAAWYRGWLDQIIARLADVLFAFPSMIFGLIVAAILGPGALSAVLAIFFIVLPTMVRVVRSAALTVVGRDFVVAAQISGASTLRLLAVHVLPNVASVTVVQMAYLMSIGMIIESGLSFLGLGIQPPASSLGVLLRENAAFLNIAPWMVMGPGAVLTLTILCVNYFGDAARSIIEPAKPRPLE
ncbi:MAG: ABC transporter permease [Cypionkella sp.]|jgi:peptide/nickel transport system permease protein|nr:ABC transporter permease [Cypionkella sp.]